MINIYILKENRQSPNLPHVQNDDPKHLPRVDDHPSIHQVTTIKMTWWEETAPWHVRVAHTVFQQWSRNQPALPATVQSQTLSSLQRQLWAHAAYKTHNGGFCLYGQSLHFWSICKWVWTLMARDPPDFTLKAISKPHTVYSLCTPHYSGSDHGASSTVLFLPLAPQDDFEKNMLSSLLTAEVWNYHKHIFYFSDVLLSFILQHNWAS